MPKYREQLKSQMKKVRVIDQEIKSRIQVSRRKWMHTTKACG